MQAPHEGSSVKPKKSCPVAENGPDPAAPIRAPVRIALVWPLAVLLLVGCAAPTRPPAAAAEAAGGERVPGGLVSLQDRADQAYAEGRLLDAEQLYRQLLREMPQSAYAWLRLGNVQLRNSELEAAARSYRECLKFAQEDARCWNNLALTYVKMANLTLDQASQFITDPEQAARLDAFRRRVVDSTSNEVTEGR